MKYENIVDRLHSGKQDVTHLCRLYLYAGASSLDEDQLFALRQSIMSALHLDEAGFMKAMEECSEKWTAKSVRQSARLASSPLLEDFARRRKSSFGGRGLSLSQGKALLNRLYMLSFHDLSIVTGKNCLKAHVIDDLAALLEDEHALAPVRSSIERPVLEAGKGKLRPTSDRFVFHFLVNSRLVCDALLFSRRNLGEGAMQIIRDVFRAARFWNEDELGRFLNPIGFAQPPEDIVMTSSSPLSGLEPVIDPSKTLILMEETPQSLSRELSVLPESESGPENESETKSFSA